MDEKVLLDHDQLLIHKYVRTDFMNNPVETSRQHVSDKPLLYGHHGHMDMLCTQWLKMCPAVIEPFT